MKFTFRHTKLACYGGYMTSAIASNFPPILFIIFHKQFGLSLGDLGALVSLNFGVQMLTDIAGANIVDKKLGYRFSAIIANSLVAVGLILMGLLPNIMTAKFPALIIPTIIYAIGSGLLEVIVSPVVEAIPEDKKASNMAFLHSFYCWGQLIAILFTTLFLSIFGGNNWWIMSFFWAVIPLTTTLLFCFVPIKTLPSNKVQSSLSLFKDKVFILFLALMTASGAAEIAISQWASLFIETSLGVSKTTGDLLGPCMFALLMGVSRVFYTKFSQKLNLSHYITLCGIICVFAYITTVFMPNKYIALAAVGVIGFSVGIFWPGVLSLASEKFPTGGTALFAYLAIFGDIGCTAGPAVAALISENFTLFNSPLKAGIAVCTIFPLTVVILTLILKRMRSERNV